MIEGADISLKVLSRISDVSEDVWDSLHGSRNPFISHAYLDALEQSGAVSAETGWLVRHILLEDKNGAPLAAQPLYLKSHSYGEYVFDQGWAEAYENAGGRYYPKLQSSIPFTPASAPRLLTQRPELRSTLVELGKELTAAMGASSLHATFLSDDDATLYEQTGYLIRHDRQYHWHNQNYASFDDFLSGLTSRKRKMIRKERQQVSDAGITIHCHTGASITSAHWDALHAFYHDTSTRKWGRPYLNRDTFQLIGERMPDKCLLVFAEQNREIIAGALNFIGADTLYGRHWGCAKPLPFLHFELCYYQAIEFAITHGLKTVEAGAQGEHKIARGYTPVTTKSAHFIRDEGFKSAVDDFLKRERKAIADEVDWLTKFAPFHRQEN